MINTAIIMGRITADPELRTTQTGVSVTSFTVAVDRSYQKSGEERKADFIDVTAWRQTADFISRYFHKGSMIAIEGSLQTDNYTDKDGNKRKSTQVVANNVSFCGSKNEGRNTDSVATKPNPFEPAASEGETDDDCPF